MWFELALTRLWKLKRGRDWAIRPLSEAERISLVRQPPQKTHVQELLNEVARYEKMHQEGTFTSPVGSWTHLRSRMQWYIASFEAGGGEREMEIRYKGIREEMNAHANAFYKAFGTTPFESDRLVVCNQLREYLENVEARL